MVWLIYGVTHAQGPVSFPDLPSGVAGAPTAIERAGELRALVSRHAQAPRPDAQSMLEFGNVVNSLFRHVDVVPMRFGACLADTGALQAWLESEQDHYRRLLKRLAGCVEIGVRCRSSGAASQPSPPADSPGHAYLADCSRRYQLQSRRESERLAARLAAQLDGICRDWRIDEQSEGMIGLSFLVPRPLQDDFLRRCEQMAGSSDEVLYWSGPWPPYGFAAGSRC